MSFETAYSTEGIFENINALEANQHFFDGILTDPYAFQCSENCSYPLTCKSFKKKSTEWKKAPHFCPGKNHSNSVHTCGKEQEDTSPHTDGQQNQEHSVEKNKDRISLNIFLSTGFDVLKIKSEKQDDHTEDPSIRTIRTPNTHLPPKKENAQVNSLIRLLHYYYSESFPNNQYLFKTLDNKRYCLNDLFFDLDTSPEIPDVNKVFFGTARIIEKPTYYVVRMKEFCTLRNIRSKPSILIGKKLLTDNITLSNRFNRLSKISEFKFFYFGKIIVRRNEYLNFECKSESKLLANLYLKD